MTTEPPPAWNIMLATCPSRTSLAKIASEWTAMIVIALSHGPVRFGTIRQTVGGISGKVLAETLHDLERDGILTRTVWDEMPLRVEYELTPLGHSLREPLTALGRHVGETALEHQLCAESLPNVISDR